MKKANNMRMIKTSLSLFAMVLVLALASCNSCGSKKEQRMGPPPTQFEETMTSKDTVAVKELVDKFFTFVKENNFDEAAGMLYRAAKEPNGEPELLNNEEMADVRTMLRSVPMIDYRIEYIKFDEAEENEVLCYVIIQHANGDMPEMSTKMFFKPINYMGNWLLCLTNTEYGDKGVVKPDKRDSVERAYQREERKKQQQ